MKQLKKNEHGFSAVELVLVLVIVALIGIVGWMVYKNHNKSTPATTVSETTSTTTNPYAGWKSYTLQYENISFNYPSNWTLKDDSETMAEANQGLSPVNCTLNDGSDDVILTAPDSTSISLETGIECRSGLGYATFSSFSPIKVLGNNYYLGFDTTSNNVVSSVSVTTKNTNNSNAGDNYTIYPMSKNITGSNMPVDLFSYNPTITTSQPAHGQTLARVEDSSDFSAAKLVFESMKY